MKNTPPVKAIAILCMGAVLAALIVLAILADISLSLRVWVVCSSIYGFYELKTWLHGSVPWDGRFKTGIYMAKRIIPLCVFLVFVFSVIAYFGKTWNVSVDYGSSQIYTNEEIDIAAGLVKDEFSDFKGCELYSLSYAGDDISSEELGWRNTNSDNQYTACIVLDSSFRSPKKRSGGWEPNSIYTWRWYVAKDGSESWKLVGYGYG